MAGSFHIVSFWPLVRWSEFTHAVRRDDDARDDAPTDDAGNLDDAGPGPAEYVQDPSSLVGRPSRADRGGRRGRVPSYPGRTDRPTPRGVRLVPWHHLARRHGQPDAVRTDR